MMRASILAGAAVALALAGCIESRPVSLSGEDPANPQAAAGAVDAPTAIGEYKSPEDLASRAAAEEKEPNGGMDTMPGMSGMTMQQGGAPSSAAPQ